MTQAGTSTSLVSVIPSVFCQPTALVARADRCLTLPAEKPLAEGFQLTDGSVTFNVPCDKKIKSRTSYIVVLMGDSGNKSAQFAIERDASLCPKGGKKGGDKKGKGDKGGEPSTTISTADEAEQTDSADAGAV